MHAWEFGAGLVLLAPALLQRGQPHPSPMAPRFLSVGAAALPTALASGASVLALERLVGRARRQ